LRRALITTALLASLAVAFPGLGAAAKPDHQSLDGTFADNFCGFDGTTVQKGVDVFSLTGNTFHERYEINATFTAENGVAIVLHEAGSVGGTFDPAPNGDGTYTSVVTYKGLPEQFKLPHGGVLTRDAGVITLTDTLAPNGQGGFTLLDETLQTHGPHPEAASGFTLGCDILGPIFAAGG
jgi:hypothetical protein